MKKVIYGIFTTAAVIALTYGLVESMFIAYPTWFADYTRYLFIGQIDYYARMGLDLYEFRICVMVSYLLFMTTISVWVVAEVLDTVKAIGRAIFKRKKTA